MKTEKVIRSVRKMYLVRTWRRLHYGANVTTLIHSKYLLITSFLSPQQHLEFYNKLPQLKHEDTNYSNCY